jgi:hypothetical protein
LVVALSFAGKQKYWGKPYFAGLCEAQIINFMTFNTMFKEHALNTTDCEMSDLPASPAFTFESPGQLLLLDKILLPDTTASQSCL